MERGSEAGAIRRGERPQFVARTTVFSVLFSLSFFFFNSFQSLLVFELLSFSLFYSFLFYFLTHLSLCFFSLFSSVSYISLPPSFVFSMSVSCAEHTSLLSHGVIFFFSPSTPIMIDDVALEEIVGQRLFLIFLYGFIHENRVCRRRRRDRGRKRDIDYWILRQIISNQILGRCVCNMFRNAKAHGYTKLKPKRYARESTIELRSLQLF